MTFFRAIFKDPKFVDGEVDGWYDCGGREEADKIMGGENLCDHIHGHDVESQPQKSGTEKPDAFDKRVLFIVENQVRLPEVCHEHSDTKGGAIGQCWSDAQCLNAYCQHNKMRQCGQNTNSTKPNDLL
jgi:hypothetical protein